MKACRKRCPAIARTFPQMLRSAGNIYRDIKQVIPPTPPFLTTSASFAAKGLSTPRSVGATVNQTLFNGQQTANRVRAAVPIYQGGAEYSAIRLNKESLSQQRLNVDDVCDQTRANVVQFWGQLQAAKAQIEAAQRQNDAAERALTGVRNEALA
jgi:outer membrane protein TolC